MTTRRNFIKRAAASGVVAAAAPVMAPSQLTLGVGAYSYHSLSIDKMIVQLNRLRVGSIEMSRGEFMLLSHPQDELFRVTREQLDRGGIRCVSYYSATIKDEQDLENAIRFAKLLGCSNITGDATGDVLNRIDQRLTQEGLTFGIHNNFFPNTRFAYESPEDVLNALAPLSKTMGATADTGQPFVSWRLVCEWCT